MPEKHTLELVLDTLQRRDTYEMFAEPVNPEEVEDYYEIIKEPMDFGTMRAKLHEEMYENLEQFEHDVFLIPENAMQFNSSATTYFRQARLIHDLAKKVFHALKMDPENFVMEFSGTRRRSMRKALSESKDSRSPLTIKSANLGSEKTSDCATEMPIPHHGFCSRKLFAGSSNGRVSSSKVADRRFTYRAWRSSLFNEKDNTFDSTSSQLFLMNRVDISYRNSLVSFVKDLGPTAQMVARQKLLGEHGLIVGMQSGKCHQSAAATQREESGCLEATTHKTTHHLYPAGCRHHFHKIDLTEDGDGEETHGDHPEKQKMYSALPSPKDGVVFAGNHRSTKIGRGLRDGGKSDDHVRPVILALKNSHSKGGTAAECKVRNKKSRMLPWSVRCGGLRGDLAGLKEEGKKPPPAGPSTPLTSKFTFDLPFLKARLDQMNALETAGERLKRPSFGKERGANGSRGVDNRRIPQVYDFIVK